jgi:hypothetical protein
MALKIIAFSTLLFFLFPLLTFSAVEVIGSLKRVHTVNPGETVRGQIKLQNNDATDQEVRIYQTDYLFNHQEQTYYDEPGSNKRSNASWIEYSPKTVVSKSKRSKNGWTMKSKYHPLTPFLVHTGALSWLRV